MCCLTLTSAVPRFELTPRSGKLWRFAEAQHRVSTMRLVDRLDEQRLLEELLDDTKPPVPADCAHLHYLLFTPFRYAARHATRFRAAGDRRGVFYSAERIETAAAEMAFYRLLFYLESPATAPPQGTAEFTAFSVKYRADVLDLTGPDWRAEPAVRDRVNYARCHELAEAARQAGAGGIRYASVRDVKAGANVALLSCAAFAEAKPRETQGWHFRVTPERVIAVGPDRALEFLAEAWDDPRLRK